MYGIASCVYLYGMWRDVFALFSVLHQLIMYASFTYGHLCACRRTMLSWMTCVCGITWWTKVTCVRSVCHNTCYTQV
jgi:hypothetical protein